MRRLLPLLLVLVPFAVPATAGAFSCRTNPNGRSSFCTVHLPAHRSGTFVFASDCHPSRIYAIDASPDADVSADAHYVAPHRVHMKNGPMSVYGTYLPRHQIRFENESAFAVNVYFTRICRGPTS